VLECACVHVACMHVCVCLRVSVCGVDKCVWTWLGIQGVQCVDDFGDNLGADGGGAS